MLLRAVSEFFPSGDHDVVICEVQAYCNGNVSAATGDLSSMMTTGSGGEEEYDAPMYTSDLRALGLIQ